VKKWLVVKLFKLLQLIILGIFSNVPELPLNEPYFFTKERAEKHIQRQLIATCIMNLEAST